MTDFAPESASPPLSRSRHDRKPLRIALVVSGRMQPEWVARLAEALQQNDDLVVSLVLQPSDERTSPPTRAPDPFRRVSGLLFRAFERYDRRRIPPGANAEREVDVGLLMPDRMLPTLEQHDRFDAGLYLPVGAPDAELLAHFEYGVVALEHGPRGSSSGTPPAVREVLSGHTVLHGALVLWRAGTALPEVVHSLCLRTDRLSVAATARHYYRHVAHMLALRLPVIARGDRGAAFSTDPQGDPVPAERPAMVGSLSRMAMLRLERGIRARLQQEDWTLATARPNGGTPLQFDPRNPVQQPSLLLPPPGMIWADPFPIRRNDRTWVFYEEMRRDGSPGFISLMELTDQLEARPLGPVLTASYHLSYPFVFEWQGSLFMLPETDDNRTVELHRCVSWPDTWTLEAVLLDNVSAVDATIIEIDGEWWMFTTMNPQRDVDWNTSLYIFRASTPLGPWTPHRGNPVKADVRNSRSAGRLFWDGGRLHRPTQDCAERYGHALVVNEIRRLDPDGFEERAVHRVEPGWRPDVVGVHTINQVDDLYLFDCKVRRRKS